MGIEEEYICNQSRIVIFDTNTQNEKRFIGFQGSNCDVKLSLGGTRIECNNHKISCSLVYSHIYNIELFVKPYDNVSDSGVKLFWTNEYVDNKFIVDETLDEILTTIVYAHCGIGVNFELHKDKNKIKKIIKELSNKHFLQDITQESKVIEILESHYNDMRIF
jgi:hypothetical protein